MRGSLMSDVTRILLDIESGDSGAVVATDVRRVAATGGGQVDRGIARSHAADDGAGQVKMGFMERLRSVQDRRLRIQDRRLRIQERK